MKKHFSLLALVATASFAFVPACGDDDEENGDGSGGRPSTDGGDGNGGKGSGGKGSGGSGQGGSGGGGLPEGGDGECDLSGEGKDREEIPSDTGTMTLTSNKVWELNGITTVGDGETLTIEPCTRIEGQPEDTTLGPSVLVVQRGGKIMAEGTANEPILFTSWESEVGERRPGDWGGIILLGRAPNNLGDEVAIEGLPANNAYQFGGDDPEDDSGVMTYVRIEYPGYEIAPNSEVNGLTLGAVGSGTEIHHVMVSNTLDDCFEFFGGTVDVHHLIANNCGDDMFDADQGYTAEWDTLFGRQINADSSDPNGYECDNNNMNPTLSPVTFVTSSKVTLCGAGEGAVAETTNGAVFRRGFTGEFTDQVFTGFHNGVSLRDGFGTPEDPNVVLTDSMFFENFSNNIGTPHGDTTAPIDPVEWFEAEGSNEEPDPAPFTVEDCQAEDGPNAEVTGSGTGAFKDESDWMQGDWIDWATE